MLVFGQKRIFFWTSVAVIAIASKTLSASAATKRNALLKTQKRLSLLTNSVYKKATNGCFFVYELKKGSDLK
jgi:hypothetical protein